MTVVSCSRETQKDSVIQKDNGPIEKDRTLTMSPKEVFTLYRKIENTFQVARAMKTSNENFELHLYEVKTSLPEVAVQTFTALEQLTPVQLAKRKIELERNYKWTPFKSINVLFVQIQPQGFKDEFELLDKRQSIEIQLTDVLEKSNLGEWFASDLGPGGGNMLFKVTDVDAALENALTMLKKIGMDNAVVVGRRISTADDDWFYEVIYPTKFTGTFNTM